MTDQGGVLWTGDHSEDGGMERVQPGSQTEPGNKRRRQSLGTRRDQQRRRCYETGLHQRKRKGQETRVYNKLGVTGEEGESPEVGVHSRVSRSISACSGIYMAAGSGAYN